MQGRDHPYDQIFTLSFIVEQGYLNLKYKEISGVAMMILDMLMIQRNMLGETMMIKRNMLGDWIYFSYKAMLLYDRC